MVVVIGVVVVVIVAVGVISSLVVGTAAVRVKRFLLFVLETQKKRRGKGE